MAGIVRDNRSFIGHAVRYLAGEAGIRQFIDLGGGLPTQTNVHQMAQRVAPDARVAYIDNDPVVWSHGQALLDLARPVAQLHLRSLAGIQRFFDGFDLIDPGVVWINEWRSVPGFAAAGSPGHYVAASAASADRQE